MANMRCLVIHSDGICPGPFGKCTCYQPPEQSRQAGYLEIDHGSGLDWKNKPVTIDEIEKAVEANGGKFYYGEVGEEQPDDTVEELSAIFHDIYQKEAHRQEAAGLGSARHYDEYEKLSEPVKEFDRVLARYVIDLIAKARAEERDAIMKELQLLPSYSGQKISDYDRAIYDALLAISRRTPNHEGK